MYYSITETKVQDEIEIEALTSIDASQELIISHHVFSDIPLTCFPGIARNLNLKNQDVVVEIVQRNTPIGQVHILQLWSSGVENLNITLTEFLELIVN